MTRIPLLDDETYFGNSVPLQAIHAENRTEEQRAHDRAVAKDGNVTKKNTPCIGCGKLCYGNSRTVPKVDHLCMDCRRKRNLVHCDHCGRQYQRRRRADQPGLHNYCSAECLYADKRTARDNKRSG